MYFKSLNFEKRIINEELFNNNNKEKNIKKNCLPIDLNKSYSTGRIICANTHYLTAFRQAIESSGVKYGLLGSMLGGLIFGGIGAVPGLLVFLRYFYGYTVYPLIRQHNARDFLLFPILEKEKAEDKNKIIKVYEQFNNHPVLSINDGKVVKVTNNISNNKHYGPAEGNHIIIDHYNGEFFSLYAHLYQNSIIVQEGDIVKKGQQIAEVGNTGNSESPHLHFEITYTHPDKYFSWGKKMINFENYMYAPINITKILTKMIKNDDNGIMNELTKKLELNKSGELDNCCFVN